MVKKIVVKKKRRLKLSSVVGAIFTFSLIMVFSTTVFVRTMNQKISNEVQTLQKQINDTQVANEVLTKEISDLRSVDRVVAIAEEAGLTDTDSAVTIKGD